MVVKGGLCIALVVFDQVKWVLSTFAMGNLVAALRRFDLDLFEDCVGCHYVNG